ncbi:CpsB/CapC family capsule biosynthesis tyrosine phosphatase [Butyrivibrio sp. WCD3002]|jgi:protein-tyrosine phosphatase|uniref:CpsB/CapC family capsule biosynthesis tyrosine phosphatase n=1 Tax=Butyrivibrio sp. WCD3002 TaxID=1280676 RepID=UPI00041A6B5B|nr:CpsB/CapC family capsule biosynthesis tyrosine phosphatase [Butyrivibrio sp. WCD3002]
MIDFHTHILPGIDDGSRNLDMTKELIQRERQQGIDKIVFTPHFYAQNENAQHFLEKRDKAYESVKENCADLTDGLEFKLGAEVYYFPGMGKADILPRLCMEGTDYILLEMPFAQWTSSIYRDVKDIIEKQKLRVILAHIERFYQFQKDKAVWSDILDLPVIPQINTGSFLSWKSRRFDIRFIKEGHGIILGTDCHNITSRVPNLTEGRAVIEKKLGASVLENIDKRGKLIWENEEI